MAKRARDAEELKKRKVARLRFRNLIRSVALNRIWLMDSGDQKLSLNVKKNISMLVRTRRKIGLLTMAEKSLIRTPFGLRSVQERKKLVTLMANLTCLSKIAPKVRARLAKVVTFMVIGSGRTIIKEGHPASTVYFLLTGEVEVSKVVFDHITNSYVQKVDIIVGSGECIGDVEMLERCPRRNTYVSTSVVELLVVFENDFDTILRPSMSKQWNERKEALKALDYFEYFTDDQLIEACKMSTLKQFDPLETIYYEDKGQVSYVHFVVSGVCMILQCLRMRVHERKGDKTFELIDISKEETRSIFQDNDQAQIMKMLKDTNFTTSKKAYDIDALLASDEEDKQKKDIIRKLDIKSVEAKCGMFKEKEVAQQQLQQRVSGSSESYETWSTTSDNEEEEEESDTLSRLTSRRSTAHKYDSEGEEHSIGEGLEVLGEEGAEGGHEEEDEEDIKNLIELTDPDRLLNVPSLTTEYEFPRSNQPRKSHKKHKRRKDNSRAPTLQTESNRQSILTPKEERPSLFDAMSMGSADPMEYDLHSLSDDNVSDVYSVYKMRTAGDIENRFIDVGSLTFGGIFGLGETMEHRVIMALTTVQCIILPRFWLLNKPQNPGNIWQRRRFYLDSTIPSRQSLFKDFLTTRKWQKFKKGIIERDLDPNSRANTTRIQDVPIICQILEGNED